MGRKATVRNKLQTYLNSIVSLTQRSDTNEESYYPALANLLSGLAETMNRKVEVIVPRWTTAGKPDFCVRDSSYQVIGYIEAKAPGAKLDQIEASEQLQRYLHTFPNVILTDFYEFRLYRNSMSLERALLARPFIAQTMKTKLPDEQVDALTHLFETFFSFVMPPSSTAEDLAHALARRTRFLRDEVVRPELAEQIKQTKGYLCGTYQAFQQYLIANLTEDQFADLYAQTITYGLFAARTRVQGQFNRKQAYDCIPDNIGILRDVFQFISLGQPSPQMETIVDDIATVLNAANVKDILTQYYQQGKGDDPILHFYETFLAAYDPETRERRGVYYTPQPVVRYIVRAVHNLLKNRFSKSDGLADKDVTLLDPAAGTLTFLAEAIQLAFQEFIGKYGAGAKANFLRSHILPNFYAFELLMAPYAVGHMKIGFLLETLGIPLQTNERFQFYLTNALEMEDLQQISIPGLASLSEESHHAAQVKKNKQILVILGNPPYSGVSANQNKWIKELLKTDLDGMQSYYTVDGRPLGEKNPKWLQDDYVKFLRFAQWKIHEAGRGIVAMITNHSYLDNPTFRGMRQSLLKTFDEIYILDLHGNSLKRETTPYGGVDENVFDIRQGVAIALMVKHGNAQPRGVHHAHLYGLRADKFAWLDAHGFSPNDYQTIEPASPYYFFIPRQAQGRQAYRSWLPVTEIFPINSVGIVTARDRFAIAFDKTELQNRVLQFKSTQKSPNDVLVQAYNLKDKPGWSLTNARQKVQADNNAQNKIYPILYRPFDVRYIFYHEAVIERPRSEVMRHMLVGENLGLITVRRCPPDKQPAFFFITGMIISNGVIRSDNMSIDMLFPLYLYPSNDSLNVSQNARQPNLANWLLPKLGEAYGSTPEPERVLAYVYAVFYSPTYRQKYAQELRTDFPRVPFTDNGQLFNQMSAFGQQLIDLHLLRNPANTAKVRYEGKGNDVVEKVRYDMANGRVYINDKKYFEGITQGMWEYQIGSYQVLEKYLKDRKGRCLDDPVRYIRIASAIAQTIDIQAQLDRIYPQVEARTLTF